MADNLRSYLVGATVLIFARVTLNEDVAPTRVFLGALAKADGTPMTRPTDYDFTLNVVGEYILSLSTTGWDPGTYRYQVVALGASNVTAIVEDFFVVAPALITVA